MGTLFLKWKYNGGNNWGVDKNNPKGCIGCGRQGNQTFYSYINLNSS
jgi:hypothetical protein